MAVLRPPIFPNLARVAREARARFADRPLRRQAHPPDHDEPRSRPRSGAAIDLEPRSVCPESGKRGPDVRPKPVANREVSLERPLTKTAFRSNRFRRDRE